MWPPGTLDACLALLPSGRDEFHVSATAEWCCLVQSWGKRGGVIVTATGTASRPYQLWTVSPAQAAVVPGNVRRLAERLKEGEGMDVHWKWGTMRIHRCGELLALTNDGELAAVLHMHGDAAGGAVHVVRRSTSPVEPVSCRLPLKEAD